TSFVGRERELAEVRGLLGASGRVGEWESGGVEGSKGSMGSMDSSGSGESDSVPVRTSHTPHTSLTARTAPTPPLSHSPARLLTLTGAGGTGKTRLALQVAADLLEEYPDDVWFVELAALSDGGEVPHAVASAMELPEEPGKPLLQSLVENLRHPKLLLILDNCEHLLEACSTLADTLLRACPDVQILATSREALNIQGERTCRLPSLSLPPAVEGRSLMADGLGRSEFGPIDHQLATLNQYEAVRLFVDRARDALPSFALTAETAPAVVQI